MERLEYSLHAARGFLAFLVLVGGATATGHWVRPGVGWWVGSLSGLGLFFSHLFWRKWTLRRGDEWTRLGRELGLRSLFSERATGIPIEGFAERGHVLGGVLHSSEVQIGDRLERYLVRQDRDTPSEHSAGGYAVSDPIPEETYFAIWVPGLSVVPFQMGRRRSLVETDRQLFPDDPVVAALHEWIRRNPGWRLEGSGNCVVGFQPNRVVPLSELPSLLERARSLVQSLESLVSHGAQPP